MPAGSLEIANAVVQFGRSDGRAFDQLQLQNLVYVANGWCLAIAGQPLTTDLPAAFAYGPAYRRLSDALACFGLDPISERNGSGSQIFRDKPSSEVRIASELDPIEREITARIYKAYADFTATDLFAVTRRGDSPWRRIFDNGRGEFRDIPHALVKAQFVRLASQNAR